MDMDEITINGPGTSDTRSRQGGGIVPAPPRSGLGESGNGLPVVLPARIAGEEAIADELLRKRKMEEGDGRDTLPLRLCGGGDDEEETPPFTGFAEPNRADKNYLEETVKIITQDNEPDIGDGLYNYVEDVMMGILDPNISRRRKEHHGMLIANVVKRIADAMYKSLVKTKAERDKLFNREEEINRRMEEVKRRERVTSEKERKTKGTQITVLRREIWTQANLGPDKKDIGTQTKSDEKASSEIDADMEVEEREEEQGLVPMVKGKLDEIIRRIEKLEKKKDTSEVNETSFPWIEAVRRKNKKKTDRDPPSLSEGREIQQKKTEEEEKRKGLETKKKKATPIRMLKRKINRGAGVLIEIQRGTQGDYENVIKRCQKEISLTEMDIPPIGIKKARAGGILLEIRCKEREDEKAELLASKIKEVVRSVEGAQVRRPLRRTRLRMSGLPFGVTATEIATAVAEIGEGQAGSVRVGPLRTSAFGAGTAWADCPVKMALRAAEAAGFTLGWARVGVTLERGGPPQCHRCLARGHLRRWCPSGVSRGACCLRCGKEGHQIGRCGQKPHCPICEERGLQADHRPGDPSTCRPVPPGADREARPPQERPDKSPSPGPGEGSRGGANKDRGASVAGGDLSPPGAEAPSSLDPGEGSSGVGRGPAAGARGAQNKGRPSGRLWGVDLSPSGSGMETELEVEGCLKRKSQDAQDCSVVLAPLPAPPEKGEKGKRKKKR